MNKAKLNYWVDLATAVAAAVSLLSGLIFLLPPNMAGIGPDGFPRMLGLTLLAWSDLHTIGSLAMIAGVGAHLALHGRWICRMTKCVSERPVRARRNYWVDVVIAIALLVSGISGGLFLLPPEASAIGADGYPRLLGLKLILWSDLHTTSSLVMVAGVGVHLVLHARWIQQMTRCVFRPSAKTPRKVRRGDHCPETEAVPACRTVIGISRRRFVRLGWLGLVAAACTGTVFAAKELFGEELGKGPDQTAAFPSAESNLAQNTLPTTATGSPTASPTATPTEEPTKASSPVLEKAAGNGRRRRGGRDTETLSVDADEMQPSAETPTESPTASATVEPTPEDTLTAAPATDAPSTEAPTPTAEPGEVKVACPRGMVWDAYPGHCRLYVDRNGNGYCDYSEPIES